MVSERDALPRFVERAFQAQQGLFDSGRPISVARAPGRLDVMGGIADYSGSLVLELPLREAAFAGAQVADDERCLVVSLSEGRARQVEVPLHAFVSGPASAYQSAREYFARDEADHWAAYALGALTVLRLERGARLERGLRLLIESDVPEGKGVSSSAALEVAAMSAIAAELELSLPGFELARLCQKVENLVAGAPCGIMDQVASALGEEGRLLELCCQPATLRGHVEVPPELAFFGVDSGVRHAVTGADYGTVRAAAFMGHRIIAEIEGFAVVARGQGAVEIADPLHGYLANVPPRLAEERYRAKLPERITGREFLERYSGTADPLSAIEPDRVYPVRASTLHPIFEHARVSEFAELLRAPLRAESVARLGELMRESHDSYSACGLGSQGTDEIVRLVEQAGPEQGLFGAKITGGGSGGTVAILGRADALPAVMKVAARYRAGSGREARVFQGSSPGAVAFGAYRARRTSAHGGTPADFVIERLSP